VEANDDSAVDGKTQKALDLLVNTYDALTGERGGEEKIWGSMIKQAMKRRNPGFNETYHGFKSFNSLLEEAAIRGLLKLEHDEKSGGYIVRSAEAGESVGLIRRTANRVANTAARVSLGPESGRAMKRRAGSTRTWSATMALVSSLNQVLRLWKQNRSN
jgi:hypothetical protein